MTQRLKDTFNPKDGFVLKTVNKADHSDELDRRRFDTREALCDYLRATPAPEGATYDLSGKDLSGVDLHGAQLGHVVMNGTDLSGADLHDVTFYGGAELSGANFTDTNFAGAHLTLVTADKAVFDGAQFGGAYLGYSSFQDCSFKHADMGKVVLDMSQFDNAKMHHASFRGAKLIEPSFHNAELDFADFSDLDVTLTIYLEGASLLGTKMPPGADVEVDKGLGYNPKVGAASLAGKRRKKPRKP